MDQYVIGGAVRDILLGKAITDIDFVWVNATPTDMINMGMSKVGANFPVFIDVNGNEHALARTEHKTGSGYNGFECQFGVDVSLADDQKRRDLTINQLAVHINNWEEFRKTKNVDFVLDACDGLSDLRKNILRHASIAFRDDPVRLLRIARFSAKYDMYIAPATMDLMVDMVNAGELNHLTPARVWKEFERVIDELSFHTFCDVLTRCGAFNVIFPGMHDAIEVVNQYTLQLATATLMPTMVKYVLLFAYMTPSDRQHLFDVLPIPNDIVSMTNNYVNVLRQLDSGLTAKSAIALLYSLRAYCNSDVLILYRQVFGLVSQHRVNQYGYLMLAYTKTKDITYSSLSAEQQQSLTGIDIKKAIMQLQQDQVGTIF